MLHSLIAFSADLIVELSTKENTQNVNHYTLTLIY